MANVVRLKRGSGSDPSASDLVTGELAVRTDTGKLFTKKDDGSVAEISGGGGGSGISDGDKGDITVSNSGGTFTIDNGVINSNKIADGAIVNADINASAAIAGTKIDPNFGTQDVTGRYINANDIFLGDVTPELRFTDSDNNPDYQIRLNSGILKFKDITNGAERMQINADGHVDILGNLDVGAGIDVTGDISVSGTVDGVDIASLNSTVSGKLSNIVEDTSPQLGGDLDMNSNFISSGILGIKNTGSQSEVRLYCESNNAHYAGIKAPAHADFSGNLSFTLPSGYGSNGQVLQSNGSGGTSWVAQTTAYTNSSVDSHLNTSSASSGQILSWNGSDYAWVADQTGGGGGGISNLVEDTTPQLGGNLDMQTNNISGTGTVIANSTAVATAGMRKIHLSSSAPSGSDGAVGDIWVKY